jgi:rRNA maturation RNase YbeY
VPVLLQNRQRVVVINGARLSRTATAILAAARIEDTELSVLLVSDRRMRVLNRRYRNKDRTTDVLAFPMQISPLTLTLSLQGRGKEKVSSLQGRGKEKISSLQGRGKEKISSPPSGERTKVRGTVLLGDVVISMPTAQRQAAQLGHGLYDEVTRLLVHGVLHLLGYDHERGPREAARMARKERAILKAIP